MRKTVITFAIASVLALGFAAASAQAAAVSGSTPTAALLMALTAHSTPSASSSSMGVIAATRPLTGSQTVLPVIGSVTVKGNKWLRVLLPQRPDSSSGWIPAADVETGSTPWHIVVDRAARQASIYKDGQLVNRFSVIVGKPSTPTPSGNFFVAEIAYEGYSTVSGPYALLTSAYSNVYQSFEGGPGQVALHGIVGLSDPIGTAASHGCVRFADANIVWLATHVSAGTPITIN
jgi:lipoprotein-anchoring transpeptidase ErfK/SrfK